MITALLLAAALQTPDLLIDFDASRGSVLINGSSTPVGNSVMVAQNFDLGTPSSNAWVTGDNHFGQLGIKPNPLLPDDQPPNFYWCPQPIGGTTQFLKATVWQSFDVTLGNFGGGYTFLRQDGEVQTIGSRVGGRLGDNGVTTGYTNALRTVRDVNNVVLSDIVDIASYTYANFAMEDDGTMWSWGQNHEGILAINNSFNNPPVVRSYATEIDVSHLTFSVGEKFVRFIDGDHNSFTAGAITNDGRLALWGSDERRILNRAPQNGMAGNNLRPEWSDNTGGSAGGIPGSSGAWDDQECVMGSSSGGSLGLLVADDRDSLDTSARIVSIGDGATGEFANGDGSGVTDSWREGFFDCNESTEWPTVPTCGDITPDSTDFPIKYMGGRDHGYVLTNEGHVHHFGSCNYYANCVGPHRTGPTGGDLDVFMGDYTAVIVEDDSALTVSVVGAVTYGLAGDGNSTCSGSAGVDAFCRRRGMLHRPFD